MKKTLIPDDFRDFLSILSILGFVGIFMKFVLDNVLISESMDAIFLIVGGVGLMVSGKVFQIKEWLSDGLQKNEVSLVLSVVFGISSIFVGLLLLMDVNISIKFAGFVGILALFPAIFIMLDYISKNTRNF